MGDHRVPPGSLRLEVATIARPENERRLEVVLRDDAGVPCAYGGTSADRYWVAVPGVGLFELRSGSADVRASVLPHVPHDRVLDGYYGTALPLLAQAVLDYEVLHASAVVMDGVAVAFCAQTGVGKSTIASALSKRGFALWADDALAFALAGGLPVSVSLPFTTEGPAISPAGGRDEVPLAAVCLLERLECKPDFGASEILRASPSDAVAALLAHAYRFVPQTPERRRGMVQTYLEVAARVPMLLVRFAHDPGRLSELIDRIESALRKALSERD